VRISIYGHSMGLTVEQALQQAIAVHNEGKLQEAESLYRAILQSQPKHPTANHNLGLVAISVNESQAALPLFKLALTVNPSIEQFWISYIDTLIKVNQFKNAKRFITKAKKAGFVGEKFIALEAQLVQTSQRLVQEKLVPLQTPPQAKLNSMVESYQNGQHKMAQNLARSITKQFPDHPFSWKVLGALLAQTGQLDEALIANQKTVALDPNDVEAHSNLGVTLHDLGRLEQAKASYKQAITLKPDYAEAHNNLGNTLKELGRLEQAEASYKKAIALNPQYAEAHYNLGIMQKEHGRLTEAEASYSKAITLKADYGEALLNRGQILFDKAVYEGALRDFDLCNTEDSRARALACLYALGKIEDIYKRIETHSEKDDENIRVAAIASFIAEREKKDTAHNFCKKPLDFLYFSSISSHIEDANSFITELIEELQNIKTIWEPSNKTTRKGFQSGIDLFKKPLKKMRYLKSIIIDELDSYYTKFENESCSYIQKWPSEKRLVGWHVILKQQGHQTAHIHSDGWLSGVIYLKVVPSLGKNEGSIEFGLSGENYFDVDLPKVIYQPKLGDIVFFPSSLHHRTVPFTTDTDRIIVSFDLMPVA